ncbi:COMM domain-containing protein 1-like [Ostrea edulis]|uniref:COMM domain-containing protein 1-like n=1 Tax=Ostrea edulis TaxID=37623 RepID=UPI00209566DE|nr:COMM domain-containing protein 1-like [Ostrea edulis]
MTNKMADTKTISALLTGLARRRYYNESEYTDEFLKSQIFPDSSDEEYASLLRRCSNYMKSMVSADMDFNQLEAFLTSQMKRREAAMTEEEASAYRKFWKVHKNKIHDTLVSKTNWNNSLKKVSWRIDVKSQAKNTENMNEPTAIVELQIENQHESQKADVVQFEMDENKLANVLQNMKDIEDQIVQYCQQ